MKEYIKLFNNLESADGYLIVDIPFTSTVKRDAESLAPQNIRCNKSNRQLVANGSEVRVARLPQENTVLVLSDGSEVELTGDTITMSMTEPYRTTLVEAIVGTKITQLGGDLMHYALMTPFAGCSLLTSVTISNSVTILYDLGCTGLTSVVIPDSVTTLGSHAFQECANLTDVTIGSGVTSIEYGAFDFCYALKSVNYRGTISNWNSIDIGYSVLKGVVVHCTDGDIVVQ